jgi:hypothetical protein
LACNRTQCFRKKIARVTSWRGDDNDDRNGGNDEIYSDNLVKSKFAYGRPVLDKA